MNLKMTIPDSNQPIASVEQHTRATIRTLFGFLYAQGQGDYLGERVTQLEHSLQCAHLAAQSSEHGNDSEVILAALLHDVGRFIPAAEKMGKMVTSDGQYIGRQSHEVLGEAYLRRIGFSEKVCTLVGAHVMAKRYLVATDKEYYDGLSETSKRTLKFQVCYHIFCRRGLHNTNENLREEDSMPNRSKKLSRTPCWMQSFLSGDGMILPKIPTSRYLSLRYTKSWPTNA